MSAQVFRAVRLDRHSGSLAKRIFWTSWIVTWLLAVLWSIATPISASPDEPAHIIRAASVVRGEFIGPSSAHGNIVTVPKYIAWTNIETCYAFKAATTASCAKPVPGDSAKLVETTTSAGLYNPVYYLTVGWPSLIFPSDVGIYAMRIMSALVTTLFLALSFMMVSRWRRPGLPILSLAVVATPMLLFLAGAVNPNAVEATATLCVFIAMLSLTTQSDTRALGQRAAILAASAMFAVNARGLSLLWVAVALALPLFLTSWKEVWGLLRNRHIIFATLGIGIASAFAAVWLLLTNLLTTAVTTSTALNDYPGIGDSFGKGFLSMVNQTFAFAAQMIGLFGWMDTPAPSGVVVIWTVLIGGLLLATMTFVRGRRLRVFVALLALSILLPSVVQAEYITAGGFIWQGRYDLPLFACLLMAAAAFLSALVDRVPRYVVQRTIWIILILTGVGQAYSYAFVLKRYATGIQSSWPQFIAHAKWQAPGANLVLLALFCVVFACGSYAIWRSAHQSPGDLDPTRTARSSAIDDQRHDLNK